MIFNQTNYSEEFLMILNWSLYLYVCSVYLRNPMHPPDMDESESFTEKAKREWQKNNK